MTGISRRRAWEGFLPFLYALFKINYLHGYLLPHLHAFELGQEGQVVHLPPPLHHFANQAKNTTITLYPWLFSSCVGISSWCGILIWRRSAQFF
jgi:hypothetical protein